MESTHEQKAIKRAWKAFNNNEPVSSRDVKDFILRGWKISRAYGIDPEKPPKAQQLPASEFQKLINKYADILEAADSVLEMMEISLRDTGFIMTVTAYPGYLLKVSGADRELSEADRKFTRAGTLRSVEQVGASALSLSMLENKPIEVSGNEHYNIQFRQWCCCSAPIHDPKGNVVGSLTVSGHMPNKHSHTLALVTAAASSITTQLREKFLIKEQSRLNSLLLSIYNSLTDGVLSIKTDFTISHANDKARQLLGIKTSQLEKLSLTDFLTQEDEKLVKSIIRSGATENHDIGFNIGGSQQTYLCQFLPSQSQEHMEGITIILTNKKQLIDIAKRVGGNYASYSRFSDLFAKDATVHEVSEVVMMNFKGARLSSTIYPEMKSFFS